MFGRLLKWLFGSRRKESDPPHPGGENVPEPHGEARSTPGPVESARSETKPPLDPVDLQIGLDLGTSCTKAVLGDTEQGDQIAIPLNGGDGLVGYLLPTEVFEEDGVFSLERSKRSVRRRNLKIRLIRSVAESRDIEPAVLQGLVGFTALSLRRILGWAATELSRRHPNRTPVWHLNVGMPSPGGDGNRFDGVYRSIVEAAVRLVPGDAPISRERVAEALDRGSRDCGWMDLNEISLFPEGGAQLASIVLSPHCPDGCLLVVDVGAGTVDVSTMRVRSNHGIARCVIHECAVANLGAHFLRIARQEGWPCHESFEQVIESFPDDTGVMPEDANAGTGAPEAFSDEFRNVLLPTITRYRMRLQAVHENPHYQPWTAGLSYVLSGGGRRDPYYSDLFQHRVSEWLQGIVSEWHGMAYRGPRPGLKPCPFPVPPRFGPEVPRQHFDRFSVAHGLSLGKDGMMELAVAD